LKIAVIGVGAFGDLYARHIAALPEMQLAAVVDRDRGRATALARKLRVPHAFRRFDDLLAAGVAEALVVATHADTHVAIAREAMKAGLHVLIEKPVGRNLREIRSLARAGQASNRLAMAAHICLFHSRVTPLLERVRREGFHTAHFVRNRSVKTASQFPGYHPIALSMIHDLYVAAQMANGEEPTGFSAWDAADRKRRTNRSWAMLKWKGGRVATFHSLWTLPEGSPADGEDFMEVHGENYVTKVSTNPQPWSWVSEKTTAWPIGLEISTIHGRPAGMLAEELRSFAASCRTGEAPAGCRLEDAMQVQRWLDRLMASARARRGRS